MVAFSLNPSLRDLFSLLSDFFPITTDGQHGIVTYLRQLLQKHHYRSPEWHHFYVFHVMMTNSAVTRKLILLRMFTYCGPIASDAVVFLIIGNRNVIDRSMDKK